METRDIENSCFMLLKKVEKILFLTSCTMYYPECMWFVVESMINI